LKTKKRLKFYNLDKLKANNVKVYENAFNTLITLIDPNELGYRNIDRIKFFLRLLGFRTENFSFQDELFYEENRKNKNGIINLTHFSEKIKQILLCKIIFQESLSIYLKKKKEYRKMGSRLFYWQNKKIFMRFKNFLLS